MDQPNTARESAVEISPNGVTSYVIVVQGTVKVTSPEEKDTGKVVSTEEESDLN